MVGAVSPTLRAPRTGQLFPTDMPNAAESLSWNRDNNINSLKVVFADLVQYLSATAGTNFQTYVAPAGLIATVGEGFHIRAWGRTAATANAKTVGISFGGNALIGSGALAANNTPWRLEADVFWTGSQAWEFYCTGWANGAVILETEGQVTNVDPTAVINILTTYTAAVAVADALQNGFVAHMYDHINFNTYR